ncbi:hypothetical protein GCM10007160_04940 [Litchfieldella qijiaojingensis]|uniref:DUF503 domain-containing protein n=1 Tax=Litchfieldella qijiaojingensis TaxID=980347 RepID=A0ABQ2YDF7_9GAMM|nr:DUF503 domain-containing protein [Halomonas qijiaojingensis]GGX80753.1 hypothetical protein GCM10007160_04940 [Halomonas qijiaojingensis]
MHIGILRLKFSLPGCRSLKEKRQRMRGMHERYGRNPAVAVCESADHDRLESSEWSFVVVATSSQKVESLCSEIEDKVQRTVDGRILDVSREFL